MNKKRLFPNIILICAIIISVTGVLSGVKHHETWRIILNAITLGMLIIVAVIKVIKTAR
jgi:hypothetical protein